jgi:hypothetical protein
MVTSANGFTPPPPSPEQKYCSLKQVCNVNIENGNLKYAQKSLNKIVRS